MGTDSRFMTVAAVLSLLLLVLPVKQRRHAAPPSGTHDTLAYYADDPVQATLMERYIGSIGAVPAQADSPEGVFLVSVADTSALPEGMVPGREFFRGYRWAVPEDSAPYLMKMEIWMDQVSRTGTYRRLEKGKIEDLEKISRYDDLIIRYADVIGWDWRLLAAIIYTESRFHNSASSARGAKGLMQINSSRYTAEELADPDKNLSTGTAYLARLDRMFMERYPDGRERIKFVLAAYNAGEGKVNSWIGKARENGLPTDCWDNVKKVLPSIHPTRAYVKNVLEIYGEYAILYPSQP